MATPMCERSWEIQISAGWICAQLFSYNYRCRGEQIFGEQLVSSTKEYKCRNNYFMLGTQQNPADDPSYTVAGVFLPTRASHEFDWNSSSLSYDPKYFLPFLSSLCFLCSSFLHQGCFSLFPFLWPMSDSTISFSTRSPLFF